METILMNHFDKYLTNDILELVGYMTWKEHIEMLNREFIVLRNIRFYDYRIIEEEERDSDEEDEDDGDCWKYERYEKYAKNRNTLWRPKGLPKDIKSAIVDKKGLMQISPLLRKLIDSKLIINIEDFDKWYKNIDFINFNISRSIGHVKKITGNKYDECINKVKARVIVSIPPSYFTRKYEKALLGITGLTDVEIRMKRKNIIYKNKKVQFILE